MDMPTGTIPQKEVSAYSFPKDLYGALLKGKQSGAGLIEQIRTAAAANRYADHFNQASDGKTVEDVLVESFNMINRNIINFYGHDTEEESIEGGRMHFYMLVRVFAQNHALFSEVLSDETLSSPIDWHSVYERTRDYSRDLIQREEELQRNLKKLRSKLGYQHGFDFAKYISEFKEKPIPGSMRRSLHNLSMEGENIRVCSRALSANAFHLPMAQLSYLASLSPDIHNTLPSSDTFFDLSGTNDFSDPYLDVA